MTEKMENSLVEYLTSSYSGLDDGGKIEMWKESGDKVGLKVLVLPQTILLTFDHIYSGL